MDLKEEYDRLYKKVDDLFKEYDPCQFIGSRCIQNRENRDRVTENGCYSSCSHLGPFGCKVESLGCKLFTCKSFSEEDLEFSLKISKLRREAAGICSGFVCIVTTKEDILKIYGRPRK